MNTVISPKRRSFTFSFHTIRNISSPEDLDNNRKVYAGQALVNSILDLPTNENVRDYLVEAVGKIRRRPTAVHRAIRDTLLNKPEDFPVLNSGIVIVAHEAIVDEKEKQVQLINPSIINGAQTQGVLRDLKAEMLLPKVHIKFEIIVTSDDSLVAETSIARNFQ
ncbi:MAG: AIPR family protein, partial [Chitinophagaceae bacterium]|nr:AIPR family protein [Chitinophagaceae bacterium]